ncbi:MAG TPA: ATPase, T2SS/T4P/T4SS family [Methylophilaceae bacterium]|jgi:type II secretory ATPase GspE/PulE/Tfp pilus assembly ATPase PilB-like protein
MIATNINWPAPPYFKFVNDNDQSEADLCLIYLKNGAKTVASLMDFKLEQSTILVEHADTGLQEKLNFSAINSIQLIDPVGLIREDIELEKRSPLPLTPVDLQTYHVVLSNEEKLAGYTQGYHNTETGLFIYPVTKDSHVIRTFIPRGAINQYKIGLRIGEILIEENLAEEEDVDKALEQQAALRAQRIGDYLSENQIISSDELAIAIKLQEHKPMLKIGEALIQLGLVTEAQLDTALNKQKENRKIPLGKLLVDMGVIDELALKGAMAKKLGIPYVSLNKFNFDPNAIRLVPTAFAKRELVVPLCLIEGALIVALEDPMNFKALDEIGFTTQLKVIPAMASKEDIKSAIRIHYLNGSADDSGGAESEFESAGFNGVGIDDLASRLFEENTSEVESNSRIEEQTVTESDNTLVQLVNKMILDAYKDGASDIHIETYPDKRNTRVRFRKDGSLQPYLEIPSNFRNALISRIKIMSQLDISERRKPQDGKLDFKQFGPAKIELRVATIPTAGGLEDVVMRVLAAAKPVPVDKLGLDDEKLTVLKKVVQRPYGLVLVCGPTGSGKTTTLHSLLGYINTPERKIWTAEDPVEITQAGLRQVQVNAKIGWTFANAMRSFLRADPDVIMVGEMRDQETTKIGIEASLTGHLVLSTLHTNSAPESIVRMLDLGMDPFNFADALLAILAQRLAKSLCPKCKEAYTPDDVELEELALEYCSNTSWNHTEVMADWKNASGKHKLNMHRAKGCSHCSNTGYKGRLGLYELMTINTNTKHLIQTRAPITELLEHALATGMRTLKQDGISKVLQGNTDIAQVRAVCS